jgi:hypothetical protein
MFLFSAFSALENPLPSVRNTGKEIREKICREHIAGGIL